MSILVLNEMSTENSFVETVDVYEIQSFAGLIYCN